MPRSARNTAERSKASRQGLRRSHRTFRTRRARRRCWRACVMRSQTQKYGRSLMMPVGYWLMLGSLLSFAAMGIVHKLGDRLNCSSLHIALFTMLFSCCITTVLTSVRSAHSVTATPGIVIAIAVPFGISAAVAVVFPEGIAVWAHRDQLVADRSSHQRFRRFSRWWSTRNRSAHANCSRLSWYACRCCCYGGTASSTGRAMNRRRTRPRSSPARESSREGSSCGSG